MSVMDEMACRLIAEERGGEGEKRLRAVLEELCSLVSLAWNATDPKAETASDGFCYRCPNGLGSGMSRYFRHEGRSIEYLRGALLQRLERDGIPIPDGWGPDGKEIRKELPA